ncbi:MAG: M15 family metallopeptidase [Turicibacter sp.]|nr:M15 family metallopeptidase [Turicibacter sp.]
MNNRKIRRRKKNTGKILLKVILGCFLVISVSFVSFVLLVNAVLPETETFEEAMTWAPSEPIEFPNFETANEPESEIAEEIIDDDPFRVFPFFLEENEQAYIAFWEENPDFDAETVVWKVNAVLHVPFYSDIRINNDPNPLLVNPSHRLPYGFEPARLVPIYSGNPNLLATVETVTAFHAMREAALLEGIDLVVTSAYRTAERQEVLFARQDGDGVVARPHHSEHQTGRALDLWGPLGLLDQSGPPTPSGIWVRENAHNFGFIVRYTEENTHITGIIPEPWHITYVTNEVSEFIYINRLSSLEEFVARNPTFQLNH